MKVRQLARRMALQALFEIDAVGHDPERTLRYRVDDAGLPEEVETFARRLVWGVVNHRPEIDALIQRHAPLWPVSDIAIVDRNILRMGTFELLAGATPPRVVINEAVELGKYFGSDSTHRFVNGVLAAIMQDLEQSGRLGMLRGDSHLSRPADYKETLEE